MDRDLSCECDFDWGQILGRPYPHVGNVGHLGALSKVEIAAGPLRSLTGTTAAGSSEGSDVLNRGVLLDMQYGIWNMEYGGDDTDSILRKNCGEVRNDMV